MKIEITVSLAPRHLDVLEWVIDNAPSVEQALAYLRSQCGPYAALANQDWQTAVWGKPVDITHTLKDGDRLEVLRPLRVDPKVARRERFQKQGAKTAGLFAKRRAGAKPGY